MGGFRGVDNRMLMTTISIQEMQNLVTELLEIYVNAFMFFMPESHVRGRVFII
ncbi:DUF2179 domain-containing protein, partial [Streptococcus suis]